MASRRAAPAPMLLLIFIGHVAVADGDPASEAMHVRKGRSTASVDAAYPPAAERRTEDVEDPNVKGHIAQERRKADQEVAQVQELERQAEQNEANERDDGSAEEARRKVVEIDHRAKKRIENIARHDEAEKKREQEEDANQSPSVDVRQECGDNVKLHLRVDELEWQLLDREGELQNAIARAHDLQHRSHELEDQLRSQGLGAKQYDSQLSKCNTATTDVVALLSAAFLGFIVAAAAFLAFLVCERKLLCGHRTGLLDSPESSENLSRRLSRASRSDARGVPLNVFRNNGQHFDYYLPIDPDPDAAGPVEVIPWRRREDRFRGKKLVVVLEKAALGLVGSLTDPASPMNGSENELLTTHECLVNLLDSPLNKIGRLLIYVHASTGELIEVHPAMRMPRILHRFAQLMQELLRHGRITGQQNNVPLMQVVPGPVENYFPLACQRLALSLSGRRVHLPNFVQGLVQQQANNATGEGSDITVFAVGVSEDDAVAMEEFGRRYTQDVINVCPWGLRSQCVCQMLCHEFENVWNVTHKPTSEAIYDA